jgi:hypothetical protein
LLNAGVGSNRPRAVGTGGRSRPGTGRAPAAAVGTAGPCDLVTVPARQGLEAVDLLMRGTNPLVTGTPSPGVGPVLHDGESDTLGFLVPPGTAARWDLPGSACTETSGHGLSLAGAEWTGSMSGSGSGPREGTGGAGGGSGEDTRAAARAAGSDTPRPAAAAEPPVAGAGWLVPPGCADPVTDPHMLREALDEAARVIEAADRCSRSPAGAPSPVDAPRRYWGHGEEEGTGRGGGR